MRSAKIAFIAFIALLMAACSAIKKSSKSASSSKSPSATTSSSKALADGLSGPILFTKPADGIYAPGNEELTAIQAQYKAATLNQLKEGYTIYAQGACLNCHKAQAIYQFQETEWKGIVDNMAQKAKITDAQKDAAYKYVLSIKATQPK